MQKQHQPICYQWIMVRDIRIRDGTLSNIKTKKKGFLGSYEALMWYREWTAITSKVIAKMSKLE